MLNALDELLSSIKGPVINSKPVYDLRSCLESLTDEQLQWSAEAYNLPSDSNGVDRQNLISSLFSSIITTDSINTIITAEELTPGHSPFMLRTVDAMRLADGLWSQPVAGKDQRELEELNRKLHDLEMAAHTYYPQYEGQFETDAEYEADRKKHYAEIDREVNECKTRLREYMTTAGMDDNMETSKTWRGWVTSLVLNSVPDEHLTLLQQAGLVFIFTDWDGKGRESGYRCALDKVVNWSDVVRRDRDDLNSISYNLGRAVMNRGFGGERIIGASPFKARQRVGNGEKTWTTEAPRGVKEPTVEDDVCLRLVVPVEVQKVVWDRFMESIKG